MAKLRMTSLTLFITFFIVIMLVVLLEYVLKPSGYGSLLLTLVFWTGLIQGCIALVAASDLANSRWIVPLKHKLLALHTLLLILAALFLLLITQMEIYPWMKHQGVWLQKNFFILRNFIFLVLSYVTAWKYSRDSLLELETKNRYAVIYLFVFVISQSLVAFDWVMSLEYPWFSTLLGGYFFVEALYAGMAVAGIICVLARKSAGHSESPELLKAQQDNATLMFGFSLFWAGLFFAQYLVIWYGNIPEELSYLYSRLTHSPVRELAVPVLFMLFPIPFIILMFKKSKTNPVIVFTVCAIVLLGLVLERLFFLVPNTSINVLYTVFEFLSMTYITFLCVHYHEVLLNPVLPENDFEEEEEE